MLLPLGWDFCAMLPAGPHPDGTRPAAGPRHDADCDPLWNAWKT